MNPDLSVVIVSWNVRELLRRCLESVLRQPLALEVFVVDNASSDGSAEMVAQDFPQVRLIRNADNPGYPAANNQGLRPATGRYQMILNPDTEIVDDGLVRLVRYMDQHLDVGVAGPQLLNPDGTVQSSRRHFPGLRTALFESTWLQPWAPRGLLRDYYMLDRPDEATLDVDWVKGAAVLVRREALAQVGLLDSGYFMYSEELDWCRRFKLAGWRVVYVADAQIVHYEGKSSEQVVPARHIHFHTSKVRYFRKFHGPLVAESLRIFLLANYGGQLALEAAKGLIGHKRAMRWQRVNTYWQVLRSGLKERPDA